MALTDENMVMPVTPMNSGNNGFGGFFGGDASWIILFLFFAMFGGGWGMGGFGGGMWGMDGLYPWLNNSQNINDGFRDQQTSYMVGNIQNAVTSGFGDVQTALCGGFAGVNATVNGAQNAISQQLYANQLSDLERSYAAQTASMQGMNAIQSQLAQCCCDNRAATADVKYTIATEACNTRATDTQNTQGILNAINGGIQSIKDQLCADKIDAKNDEIAQLRQEVLFARGQASQDNQTSVIRAGQATTANQLIAEMRACPIPSMPVYGQTPIFTCNNNGCGCGCNGSF